MISEETSLNKSSTILLGRGARPRPGQRHYRRLHGLHLIFLGGDQIGYVSELGHFPGLSPRESMGSSPGILDPFDLRAVLQGSAKPLGGVLMGTAEPLDADISCAAGPAADLTGADPNLYYSSQQRIRIEPGSQPKPDQYFQRKPVYQPKPIRVCQK